MKILLTSIRTESPNSEFELRYLYSVVADAPIETAMKVFDETSLDTSIYDEIVRGQYNVVYFHCDEFNEYRVSKLSEMVKKAMPSSVMIVGGLQVSFETRKFMQEHPCVDYVIRGEGEIVLFNFVRNLVTYEFDFDSIAGLAFRKDDTIIVNPYDASIPMEELPFPYDKTDLKDTDIVYYETIRGTSDRTVYNQFYPDAKIRTLALNRICTELRYFLVKRVKKVVFLDKWFNYNTERAYRIIEYIVNNDNGVTCFEMQMDGDNIDDEMVRLLSEAREGLFIFNIDIASTNAETLAAIGRKENIYQMMYNVNKLLQAHRVEVNLSIAAGLPFETVQLFERSFNKAYGLGEGSHLKVEMLRLKKGSTLRAEAEKYGYIYSSTAPFEVIATGFMPAPDLIKIKTVAAVSEYYIGSGFEGSIQRMLNDTGLKPYELFEKLADYIYDNGYENKMSKTENLYRLLYGFGEVLYDEFNDTLKLQIFSEILHEDMERNLSPDAVKKFERKGWFIEV